MSRNETEVPAPYERDHRHVAVAFAAVLKLARAGAGLSQERLAEAADIDRTYPSLLERGLRQPTLAVVIAVAFALNGRETAQGGSVKRPTKSGQLLSPLSPTQTQQRSDHGHQ
jgi:transcriptional regulator with XRE-family HTH domain